MNPKITGIIIFFLIFQAFPQFSPAEVPEQPAPDSLFTDFRKNNRVDEIVIAELAKRKLAPSERCTDEVFLRRSFLDITGTLPSQQEARAFLNDKSRTKREKLVERLLNGQEFAPYWSMKWGDLLRIKAEFPSNLWPNAAQAYSRWVNDALRDNMPYDRFVKILLTSSGSDFRDPPVNFFRAFQQRTPELIAENVALVFMGLRLNSSGLEPGKIAGLQAFFTKLGFKGTEEWKEEIVYFDPEGKPLIGADGKEVLPETLNGAPMNIPGETDPRTVFAEWLTAPDNPWFARNIANRIWAWLFGRGIVHEPDDMRKDNLPWNEELLASLAKELIDKKYDLKAVYRLILNSNTYQLSSKTNKWNAEDEEGFSRYRVRRVEAEPLIDAICQITGTGENYQSAIPEPFTFLPGSQKASAIADGSISSPVLELFGKPARNTSFEAERNSTPSVSQVQHLLNSSLIEKKIEQGYALRQLLVNVKENDKLAEQLYLRILSRFPNESEKQLLLQYMSAAGRKQDEAVYDIAWTLINTSEFLLKH
ncbi:MAG: DUF1553 domain-containing protein [Candidatus Firestonebacteria bacterium]